MGRKMTKIFIVEDDQLILKEIIQALNKWNYQTETVNDWQNIQAEISQVKPDLITMDISLPTFNGFYWTEQIRQITNAPINYPYSIRFTNSCGTKNPRCFSATRT